MSNWIACRDRFPPDWQYVLLFIPDRMTQFAVGCRYTHSTGCTFWDVGGVSGAHGMVPTHWMPLPGAPVTTSGTRDVG